MTNRKMNSPILAGMLVCLDVYASTYVQDRLVSAIMFSIGLTFIFASKYSLFTSYIGFVENSKDILLSILILINNMIGVIIMYLLILIGTKDQMMPAIYSGEPYCRFFIKSMICGMIIHMTAVAYKKSNNLLVPIMGATLFKYCGFKHCIVSYIALISGGENIIHLLLAIVGNALGALMVSMVSKVNKICDKNL